MVTRRVALAGGLASLALTAGMTESRGREAGGEMADLEGKALVIYQKSTHEHSSYLENVRIKKLGDKSFLVGDFVKLDHPTFKSLGGITHWISLDDIALFQVFPSSKEMIHLFEEGKNHH